MMDINRLFFEECIESIPKTPQTFSRLYDLFIEWYESKRPYFELQNVKVSKVGKFRKSVNELFGKAGKIENSSIRGYLLSPEVIRDALNGIKPKRVQPPQKQHIKKIHTFEFESDSEEECATTEIGDKKILGAELSKVLYGV